MRHDVIIVGGGLAGLCCARRLQQQGVEYLILEKSDGVGGRIRTDRVDGFQLDRGFQVFLTSYPEAKQVLDYEALELKPFLPGALVRYNGRFYQLTDPWRRPLAALGSVFSPVGSLLDKLRVARLRSRSTSGTIEDRFHDPETTTLKSLQDAGFSPAMIERFFRPFLGGIFLDPTLHTSSRMFHFVFRMFAQGNACLPAQGMEAIPRQIASALPPARIRFGAKVAEVQPGSVTLDSGERIQARSVVVAAEGASAAQLLGDPEIADGQGVSCLYFAAPHAPVAKPVLVLNGEGSGPVNNLCVLTNAAPSYGPRDASLVSVTVLRIPDGEAHLREEVRTQLADWFGDAVDDWHHLRTYRIPYALPSQLPPALAEPERPVRWQPSLYVCGDHRDNASIQGAMVSGRRAGVAVIEDLS